MIDFELPPLQTRESQELEFKLEPSTKQATGKVNYLEMAKDMAAMANAYGGIIIVGACEAPKGVLSSYKPASKERAAEICDQYTTALRDRLRPAPLVLAVPIEHDGGFLVVVRVEASVGQAIGVRFLPREETDPNEMKAPTDIYGFPNRVGDNTAWLQPEQLPMLMLPELRRTILLLRKVGKEPVKLDTLHKHGLDAGTANYTIEDVNPELNALSLSNGYVIAIDQIETVFRKSDGWRIRYTSGW